MAVAPLRFHGLFAKHPRSASANEAGVDTRLLMAVSALLVANSHLEAFYPKPWLAGDGLLGNSMFFFLAGFGLMRSELNRQRGFSHWYWRRLVRIYPSVLIAMAVFGIGIDADWRTWKSVLDPLAQLVWPTRYTFVAMVFPFYILYYPLMRKRRPAVFLLAAIILCFTYTVAYLPDAAKIGSSARLQLSERPYFVHTSAYFQAMVFGGWTGLSYRPPAIRIHWRVLATGGVFAGYVILKYLMVTGRFASAYAALHVLVAILCVLMFDLLCSDGLLRELRRSSSMWRSVSFIGSLTLEIYIVHLFVAEYQWVRAAVFPLNLVLFWSLTLPLAHLVGLASRSLQRWLRGGAAERKQLIAQRNGVTVALE